MEKYDFDDIEIDGSYYTTSDVRLSTTKYVTKEKYDALLADVRRLVEAAKRYLNRDNIAVSGMDSWKLKVDLQQAIAAVEAIISPPRSSPPPADTGKA